MNATHGASKQRFLEISEDNVACIFSSIYWLSRQMAFVAAHSPVE
jgi:hypothetical protein